MGRTKVLLLAYWGKRERLPAVVTIRGGCLPGPGPALTPDEGSLRMGCHLWSQEETVGSIVGR